MREIKSSHIPADLLDHLVLDICELERLTERMTASLGSADLETMPNGPLAVHLMDLLFRMEEVSGVLHRGARHRIKRVAFALSSCPVCDLQPDWQHRDRSLVGAVEGKSQRHGLGVDSPADKHAKDPGSAMVGCQLGSWGDFVC